MSLPERLPMVEGSFFGLENAEGTQPNDFHGESFTWAHCPLGAKQPVNWPFRSSSISTTWSGSRESSLKSRKFSVKTFYQKDVRFACEWSRIAWQSECQRMSIFEEVRHLTATSVNGKQLSLIIQNLPIADSAEGKQISSSHFYFYLQFSGGPRSIQTVFTSRCPGKSWSFGNILARCWLRFTRLTFPGEIRILRTILNASVGNPKFGF